MKKRNTFSKYLSTSLVSSLASSVTICIPQPAQLAIHSICVRNAITGSPIAILGKITLDPHSFYREYLLLISRRKWKSCSMRDYSTFTEEGVRCAWLQQVPTYQCILLHLEIWFVYKSKQSYPRHLTNTIGCTAPYCEIYCPFHKIILKKINILNLIISWKVH